MITLSNGELTGRMKSSMYEEISILEKRFQNISGNSLPNVYALETNYRSVQEIVDLANEIRGDAAAEQIAARGPLNIKPTMISVNGFRNGLPDMLRAMVDAALHYIDLLPLSDKGCVALMTARSKLSDGVQHYLEELGKPFTRQKRSSYQSWSVRQVLAYYRLIMDRHQDDEMERLLYWLISISTQIGRLKAIAQDNGRSLYATLIDNDILHHIGIAPEEEALLCRHLVLIDNFAPESQFAYVWQAISAEASGPLSEQQPDEQQEELERILEEFQDKTVAQALAEIDKYITFVDEDRPDQQLIVTTIDHAKSQAFDTVFLLGAHLLDVNKPKDRKRWYVSITRARNRFFFLVDGQSNSDQGDDPMLSWPLQDLYDERRWP